MENDDQSHNRDWDDQPEGMREDGQQEVGVEPCTPYSSHELLAARPSPPEFPLGYRFVPTDQELILYYLKPKVMGDPIPLSEFFANVDLYSFDPRKLIENRKGAGKDADEWYFFTPRDRKYPNGSRPNRCTPSGVWKATGKESIIQVENKTIGHKRSLAFCPGPPQGLGDGMAWNMHEYRLEDERRSHTSTDKEKGVKDKRLDEWVLCKVYTPKHSKNGQKSDHPPKQRNKQNHDRPNGNGDNAPTTACKNQGQEKAIIADGGFLEDLQSTPSQEPTSIPGRQSSTAAEFSDQCSRRCPDQPTGPQCSAISQLYSTLLWGASPERDVDVHALTSSE